MLLCADYQSSVNSADWNKHYAMVPQVSPTERDWVDGGGWGKQ